MSHSMQQPQYGAPAPAPVGPARNGLGIAALVLGIIGTVSGFIPLFFWLAGILGLIALILGLAGRGRAKRGEATNKGVALTGALLGLAALILSVVGAVITFKAVDDAVTDIKKELNSTAPKGATGSNGKGANASGKPSAKAELPEVLAADDTLVYDGGLEVTVSAAKAYKPGEFAIGHESGNRAYSVTVTITNTGKEKFGADLLTLTARAGEKGVTAEEIFDGDTVGGGFSGTVLPGKTATAQFAFSAPADAKTLSIEVSPGLEHEAGQWELKL
ncbi:DUF4352 domain-containing protein [Streptomyces coeruleoprunus]|uniref:DUF4352 domain-containing protein n=1 Tax=Streptomyces coeruleoprunus TaxID=285563 RepID=A0ABV9XK20_9ACTN